MPDSLKNRYPFRLATTSFIHRAGYAENVRYLAPLLDEIELLFLERDHLPADEEISELRELAGELDITYNIHLPMDISLADPSPARRSRSRDAVLKALELAAPLNAVSHTLHVTYKETDNQPDTVRAWQQTAVKSLSKLLDRANIAPQFICLETLDFPPQWLDAIVRRLNLPVCVDVGHVVRYGHDLEATLKLFTQDHIGIFHLHGVSGAQDHRSLDHLYAEARNVVACFLKNFHGSVSLEVFSYQELVDSMECFGDMMAGISNETRD